MASISSLFSRYYFISQYYRDNCLETEQALQSAIGIDNTQRNEIKKRDISPARGDQRVNAVARQYSSQSALPPS